MAKATLIGVNTVTEKQVMESETPEATRTHVPLPHGTFIDLLKKMLQVHEWNITASTYGFNESVIGEAKHPAARLFGIYHIEKDGVPTGMEYVRALGFRNSHDKRLPAGIVMGLQIMVCSNLDFYGESKVQHKHTVNMMPQLSARLFEMLGNMDQVFSNHSAQLETYKERDISDTETHDIIVRGADRGVYPWTFGERILKEYRYPRHEEFKDRNVWGLYNATTETLKDRNVTYLPNSTQKLHKLLGEVCLN